MLYILFPVWVSLLPITASWTSFMGGWLEAGPKLSVLKQTPELAQLFTPLLRCHLFRVSWVIWHESFPLQACPQKMSLHHQSMNRILRLWGLQVCTMVIEHPFSIWLLEVSPAFLLPLSCVLLFACYFSVSFHFLYENCFLYVFLWDIIYFFLVLTLFLYWFIERQPPVFYYTWKSLKGIY